MFDSLPLHIRELIFSKVRHSDLYETARVSTQWWTLTMASYDEILSEEDNFILDQVEFMNERMPKQVPWQWWMLMEFTKSKTLKLANLKGEIETPMVEYYAEMDIKVRTLIFELSVLDSLEKGLPNLNEMFPHLESAELRMTRFSSLDCEQFPERVSELRLNGVQFSSICNLSDVIKHPSALRRLELRCYNLNFDKMTFDNLHTLSIHLEEKGTKILEGFLQGCKRLKSITLQEPKMDKQWLALIPPSIQRIHLVRPYIEGDLVTVFDCPATFVERQLMYFICQDWTSLKRFTSSNLELPLKYFQRRYHGSYDCSPLIMKERITIRILGQDLPLKLLDSGDFQLTVLKLSALNLTHFSHLTDWSRIVPKTVKRFLCCVSNLGDTPLDYLFEDISTLETMRLYDGPNPIPLISPTFPVAQNLLSLEIPRTDHNQLESILTNCTSLKRLAISKPQSKCFSQLPTLLQSTSVRRLEIYGGDETIEDMIGHLPSLLSLHLYYHLTDSLTTEDITQRLPSLSFIEIMLKLSDGNFQRTSDIAEALYQLKFMQVSFAKYTSEYEKFDDVLHLMTSKGSQVLDLLSKSSAKNGYVKKNLAFFRPDFWSHRMQMAYVKGFSGRFVDRKKASSTLKEFLILVKFFEMPLNLREIWSIFLGQPNYLCHL